MANLASLISKVSADFLFGEPVLIKAEDTEREAIEEIFVDSLLQDLLWETALSSSYYGDGYLKGRLEDGKGIIDPVDPSMVTIETHPDNSRKVERFVIQWKRAINGQDYLRREIREFGVIKQELWMLDGDQLARQVDLKMAFPNGDAPPEEQKTGIDGFLMVHIPNFKSSPLNLYGRSDYAELETLFDEINNRVTRDGHILDKHSDPKLAIPPGVLDKEGKVRRQNLQMFEVGAHQAGIMKPEYITWNGNLSDSNTHFDRLLKLVFLVSETSPDVFGMNEGGTAESGRALRLRLMRTIAKIQRKKRYFNRALETILKETAQLAGKKVENLSLEFQDGLPTDFREEAEIREIESRTGNVSLETMVRERNPHWTEEQIQEEIDRIKEESAFVSGSGSGMFADMFTGDANGEDEGEE